MCVLVGLQNRLDPNDLIMANDRLTEEHDVGINHDCSKEKKTT